MVKAVDAKNGGSKKSSPVQSNSPLKTELDITKEEPVKVEPTVAKSEPLAPPPRPEPSSNAPDYFSGAHSTAHLATEQNPFESSFAGGSSGFTTNINGEIQTPGGTKLPSVNELTSPAGLSGVTPSFWGSLRAGPLSPAMLSGPAKDDYFSDGHHLRGSFPTPNESGLRSGLTPGGSGSMFPEPSPNTFLSQLVSGVATPTTLDFQRTAEHAQAARQAAQNITSQPQTHHSIMQEPSHPKGQFEVNQHDENNAANALYLLQARNNPTVTQQQQQPSHYEMAPRIPIHAHPSQQMNMANHPGSSPQMSNQHNGHNNGSVSTTSGRGVSEMSDENEQQSRPNTRQKGKRTSTQITQTNGRRKVDEAPPKPASKKAKANNGHAMEPEPQSEEELDMNKDEYNANGKKMTDDEKRKNFLERNRVAALKCRQRKKQWLANLQSKVEIYSQENDQLQGTIQQLQNEVVSLKSMLLAHKDCPITQTGPQSLLHNNMMGEYGHQANPYGVAAMSHQLMTAGQGMQQRRFS